MKTYLDNLRPFEKRVVVGVAALVFAVVNFWFVFPHFSDWSVAQRWMREAQQKLATYEAEAGKLTTYSNEVNALKIGGQDVPQEEQSHNFSTLIQSQAAQSGVQLQNVSRPHTSTNGDFVELSQQISVLSGEKQLVDFLYHLGSAGSQIRARDLGLRPDGPRMMLSATIKLVASFQRKAPTRAPATAPKPAAPSFKPSSPTDKPAAPGAKASVPTNKPAPPAKGPAQSAASTNKPSTVKRP